MSATPMQLKMMLSTLQNLLADYDGTQTWQTRGYIPLGDIFGNNVWTYPDLYLDSGASQDQLGLMQQYGLSVSGNGQGVGPESLRDTLNPNAAVIATYSTVEGAFTVTRPQINALISQTQQLLSEGFPAELVAMDGILTSLLNRLRGDVVSDGNSNYWTDLNGGSSNYSDQAASRQVLLRMQQDGLSVMGNPTIDGISATIANPLVTLSEQQVFYNQAEASSTSYIINAAGINSLITQVATEFNSSIVGSITSSTELSKNALYQDLLAAATSAGVGAASISLGASTSAVRSIEAALMYYGLNFNATTAGLTINANGLDTVTSSLLKQWSQQLMYGMNYDAYAAAEAILSQNMPANSTGTFSVALNAADAATVINALDLAGLGNMGLTSTNGIPVANQSQFQAMLNLLESSRLYSAINYNDLAATSGTSLLSEAPLANLPSIPAGSARSIYSQANFTRTMLAVGQLQASALKTSVTNGLAAFFADWSTGNDGYVYDPTQSKENNAAAQVANMKGRLVALDAQLGGMGADLKSAWTKQENLILSKYTVGYVEDSYGQTASTTSSGASDFEGITNELGAGQYEANVIDQQFSSEFDIKFSATLVNDSTYASNLKEVTGIRNNLQGMRLIGSFVSAVSIADKYNAISNDVVGSAQYNADIVQMCAWIASALQVPVNTVVTMYFLSKATQPGAPAPSTAITKFLDGLSHTSATTTSADVLQAENATKNLGSEAWTLDTSLEQRFASAATASPIKLNTNIGQEFGKGAVFLVADAFGVASSCYSIDIAVNTKNSAGIAGGAIQLAGGIASFVGDFVPLIAEGAKIADASTALLVVGQVLGLGASGLSIYSAVTAFQATPNVGTELGIVDALVTTAQAIAGPALYVATGGLSAFLPNFSSIAAAIDYQNQYDQYTSWGLSNEAQIYGILHTEKALDATPIVNWFSAIYTDSLTNQAKSLMTTNWFQGASTQRANYNFTSGASSGLINALNGYANNNISDVVYLRNASESFDYFNTPTVVGLLEGVDTYAWNGQIISTPAENMQVYTESTLNWITNSTVENNMWGKLDVKANFTITDTDTYLPKSQLVLLDFGNTNYANIQNITVDDSHTKQSRVYRILSDMGCVASSGDTWYGTLNINGSSGNNIFILPASTPYTTINIDGGSGGNNTVSFESASNSIGQSINWGSFVNIQTVVGSANSDTVTLGAGGATAYYATGFNYSWGGGGDDVVRFSDLTNNTFSSTGTDTLVLGSSNTASLGTGDTTVFIQDIVTDNVAGGITSENYTTGLQTAKSVTLDYANLDAAYNGSTVTGLTVNTASGVNSALAGSSINISGYGNSGLIGATATDYGVTGLVLANLNNTVNVTNDTYLNGVSVGDGNNNVIISGNTGSNESANGGFTCFMGSGTNTVSIAGTSVSTILAKGTDSITVSDSATAAFYLDGNDTVDASATTGNVGFVLGGASATIMEGLGVNVVHALHDGGNYTIDDNQNSLSTRQMVLGFDGLTSDQISFSVNNTADTLTVSEGLGDGKDDTVQIKGTGVNDYIELTYGSSTGTVLAVNSLIQLLSVMTPLVSTGANTNYTLTQLNNMEAMLAAAH
jgi:hypothetical protein